MMVTLARQIISAAAVSSGLSSTSVIDKPDKQSLLLPSPRLEIELMPQDITRAPRRIARLRSILNPATHVIHRWRTHVLRLKVRVAIRAEDEGWLEQFYINFITALPHKGADPGNNLVTVKAERAEFGGFTSKLVEVIRKREIPVWIEFSGGIYRDEEVPLVLRVNVRDGVTV